LVTAIGNKARLVLPEEVVTWAESTDAQVVLTIGAGDIDRIVPKLSAIFERNYHE
jgi:hypothetical protein